MLRCEASLPLALTLDFALINDRDPRRQFQALIDGKIR